MTTPRFVARAVVALALALGGCGDDPKPSAPVSPYPGTWLLDAKATADRMKDLGLDPDLAAIEKSALTIEIRADGTYRGQVRTEEGVKEATGTWKETPTDLTLTVLTEDGKPVENAPARVAALHDGRLLFDSSATTQPLVMRKK